MDELIEQQGPRGVIAGERPMRAGVIFCNVVILLCARAGFGADTLPSFESTAAKLQQSVVTVRLQYRGTLAGNTSKAEDSSGRRVTICSGVLVSRRLIVAPIYAGSDCRIRITLHGGAQARGRVRVIDEYSGLSLLESDSERVDGIKLADKLPKAGAWVMSGSAWGAEAPVISLGIISGTNITIPNAAFPPLIRCDLRVAETSGGAAVVNQAGQLIGIVVLADRHHQTGGWTYAVPMQHVARLLRTYTAIPQDNKKTDTSVVVLKRRRPVVGMVLEGVNNQVVVGRVNPDSPASRAGIQKGDRVLAAEGVEIRSVYQALRPILNKQPGDTISLLIDHDNQVRSVQVVLGGGVQLPSAPFENLTRWVQPKIDIEGVAKGVFRTRSATGQVHEVFAPGASQEWDEQSPASPAKKIELLEKALDRYRQVILYLQKELKESRQDRDQHEAMIRSLEGEIKGLKLEQATQPSK